MRFSADYDSEEEEYPVDDASPVHSPAPKGSVHYLGYSSEDEDDEIDGFIDLSPRAKHGAWVGSPTDAFLLIPSSQLAMYNKDKEIHRLNSLNARSASRSFRHSLVLDDLEAISVADFLRQLSLDDE